ncbi:MAG TPA: cytochrome P450 [Polyangiaceae bacterium]|jgi:cytochrome P450
MARDVTLDAIPGSDSLLELGRLLRDAPRFLHERFERHGRIFRTRLIYPVVFLVGEQANKSILVTRRHEFSFGLGYAQTAVDRVFAGSIMLQDGEAHDRTRDVLSPAVGKLAIHESLRAVLGIWTAAARGAGDGRDHDVYAFAQRTTFEVAANVLTGLALGRETEEFRPYFERLHDGIMAATKVRVPLGRLDRALRARRVLEERLGPRVVAARALPPAGLLGQLAHHRDAQGRPLPVDEIVRHLLLLFWAGYDTTASAASWALHELARRVDWQERLREEVRAMGDEHPLDEARELPQTSAFLSEIERLYPSALFFPRIAVEDVAIEGRVVPRGTPTFYSPYLSHRDPATFESPNAFDPERWLPSRGARRAVPAKLVGFGGGPRVCLGKSFAKAQLRAMIYAVLRRHRVEPDPTCRPAILSLPVHHPRGSRVRFVPQTLS